MKQFESLAATFLSDARQPEVDLDSWAVIFLGQIVLITIIHDLYESKDTQQYKL